MITFRNFFKESFLGSTTEISGDCFTIVQFKRKQIKTFEYFGDGEQERVI